MLKSKGKNIDVTTVVYNQIPFFSCKNIFLDNSIQKDLIKYMYCKDFSISPRPGSYGEQSNRWISKALNIKNALAVKEAEAYRKANEQSNKKINRVSK